MEILHSKMSLMIFNLIINQYNPYKIQKIYVEEQTLFSKCPNFLDRQVGQKVEYLSKLFFVQTRLPGRQGRPSLDICPNFRSFFFGRLPLVFIVKLQFKKNYYAKKIVIQKKFWSKQNLAQKTSGSKIIFGQKIFGPNKNFGAKKMLVQKKFGS